MRIDGIIDGRVGVFGLSKNNRPDLLIPLILWGEVSVWLEFFFRWGEDWGNS